MRYEAIHRANINNDVPPDDLELVQNLYGRRVCHIGCLIGGLLGKLGALDDVIGCEDYSLAVDYARKKNRVKVVPITTEIPDKSYDIVILDPDYYPESFDVLFYEAARIAREGIIFGVKFTDKIPEDFENYNGYIINNKYEYMDLTDERSDSVEE